MKERLISQKEMSKKYGENSSAFSMAMAFAGVRPVQKEKESASARPVNMYVEEEAVRALSKLYLMRRDQHLEKADEWQRASDQMIRKYYESIGEEPEDHRNPINGQL